MIDPLVLALERIASMAASVHAHAGGEHQCAGCAAMIAEARTVLRWAQAPAAPHTLLRSPEELHAIKLMAGDGVTLRWVQEHLSLTHAEASRFCRIAGGVPTHETPTRYRIPDPERVERGRTRWNNPTSLGKAEGIGGE